MKSQESSSETPERSDRLPPIRHIFFSGSTLGGVETILEFHRRHNGEEGILQDFVFTFDRNPVSAENMFYLGCTGRNSVRECCRRFAETISKLPKAIFVYHNFWGARYYASADRAIRRLAFVHSDSPRSLQDAGELASNFDFILCAGDDLARTVLERVPDTAGRVAGINYPIDQAFFSLPLRERRVDTVWKIGYAGRLCQEQKNVLDLPLFITKVRAAGIPFRLEIVGEGPEERELRARFQNDQDVVFHGRKAGVEFREILSSWDTLFLCSDYETGPLIVLEAMAAGVLPLMPDIPCMARGAIRNLEFNVLFPPGRYDDAVATLAKFLSLSANSELFEKMRHQCRSAVANFSPASYLQTFARYVASSLERKPRAEPPESPKLKWVDYLPAGLPLVHRHRTF